MRQVRKHRTSRACHPSIQSLAFKPRKCLIDTGTKSLGNGLQVISAILKNVSECISESVRSEA